MSGFANEGSSKTLSVSFFDDANAAATPESVSYRIDCLTTNTVMRDATPITPASTINIALTPADNAIVDQTNSRELRRVTVIATYNGGADALNDQFNYFVRNLSQI